MQADWIDFYLFLALLFLFIYVMATNTITILHKAYMAFHFSMMLWPICNFFIHIVPDRQLQWYFLNIAFVGLCFLGFGWLVFSLVLTRRIDGLKSYVLYLAAAPAVLCSFMITTNPWHMLFARPYGGEWVNRTYGCLFWFFVISCMIYLVISTTLMLGTMKTFTESNIRKQFFLCIWGVILVLVFALADVVFNVVLYPAFGFVPGLTSFGIVLSALCFVIAIQRYDLFRIVNLAQLEVIENMATGMIVMDKDDRILNLNKSALKFLRLKPGQIFDLKKLFTLYSIKDLNGNFLEEYGTNKLMSLHTEVSIRREQTWHVSLSVSPVLDGKKNLLGRIITFNDVSELRSLLGKINENNKVLQQQNRELLQVQEELYKANHKLEQLAVTDELTGCYNKRFLLQQLAYEIAIAQRYKTHFAVMLMDLDNFKHINDTYGHMAGDDVLRHVVKTVKNNLRRSDILARFGGEEFIIYAPHADREGAVSLAEKVRAAVENYPARTSGQDLRVTVSIGMVSIEAGTESAANPENLLHDLLIHADKALYEAKSRGRNCVVAAETGPIKNGH